MQDVSFDVIIVGRGPAGPVMAATMQQAGHGVAAVERHRDLHGLPRAGHVGHEVMRVLQSSGVAHLVLQDSCPTTGYVRKNAAGETLVDFDRGATGISGHNPGHMRFRPVMERALSERVAASASVSGCLG